jgi:sugar lactone lactonase YvrE
MSNPTGRYPSEFAPNVAEGWTLKRMTAPSRLFGANGLRTGPDGRIYVAQVSGSQISAIDVSSGQVETISAKGGDIIAPDDIAFDANGNLFATEVMDARVSMRGKDGVTRVLRDDLASANGITVHQGRLFIGECRIGGRIMELDLNGGAPRVLASDVPMPNAMEVGPDGMLYYPVMGLNEIWRINPAGGTPEKVAGDLGVPDSVKFDTDGFIVSTQVASGQVLRINPSNGERTVLAQLDPGLDNLTFVDKRLFVSNFNGQISEVSAGGVTRNVLPCGFNGPFDITVDSGGTVYVADGPNLFQLMADGSIKSLGMLFTPGYPGYSRGLAAVGDGELIVATAAGTIARYRPAKMEHEVLAQGLDQLYGVAVTANGAVIAAELGTGRVLAIQSGNVEVLASGLRDPLGVAIDGDGACLVSESAAGRVVRITRSGVETVVDGLQNPQGMLVRDGLLYIVDCGTKSLIAFNLKLKTRQTLACNLPLGAPPGVVAKPLRGFPPFTGPMGPYAGIAAGPDGTLYISADGDGSVLALKAA